MIWGITLQPGEVCTQTLSSQLHLTLASIECRPSKVFERTAPVAFLVLKTNACENVLCTLGKNQAFQQSLDLVFQHGEEVTFKVEGTGVVYITGYTPAPPQENLQHEAVQEADRAIVSSGRLPYKEGTQNNGDSTPISSTAVFTVIKEESDDSEPTMQDGFPEESSVYSGHSEVPVEINVSVSEVPAGPEKASFDDEMSINIQGSRNDGVEFPGNAGTGDENVASETEKVKEEENVSDSACSEMEEGGDNEMLTVVAGFGTDEDEQVDENEVSLSAREKGTSAPQLHVSPGRSQGGVIVQEGAIELHLRGGLHPEQSSADQNESACSRTHHQGGNYLSPTNQNKQHDSLTEVTDENDEILRCGFCGHTFASQAMLEKHERLHTVVRPFKCQFCDKSYAHRANVIIHERTHTGERPFRCRFCGKGFIQKYVQRVHERIHTGEKPHQCTICGRAFVQKQHLTAHERTHRSTSAFKCHICGKGFAQNASLVIHRRTHTGEQLLKCTQCNKSFIGEASLKEHVKSHTPWKKYKCQTCDEAFQDLSKLAEHESSHSSVQPFQCEHCNKFFGTEYSMRVHLRRTHILGKLFKCQFCDKSYTQRANLINHVRRHTGEKPYQCRFCSKAFIQKYGLTVHERTHTGEKPFQCNICGKAFTQSAHMAYHRKTHSKDAYEDVAFEIQKTN